MQQVQQMHQVQQMQQMQQLQQMMVMQQQQSGEVASSWDGLPSARAPGGKFGEASRLDFRAPFSTH